MSEAEKRPDDVDEAVAAEPADGSVEDGVREEAAAIVVEAAGETEADAESDAEPDSAESDSDAESDSAESDAEPDSAAESDSADSDSDAESDSDSDAPVFDSEELDREDAAAAEAVAERSDSGSDAEGNAGAEGDVDELDVPSDASLWGEDEGEPGELGLDTAARPGLEKAPPLAGGLDRLKSVLESLIFVSNKPITDRMLSKLANAQSREVRPLLIQLQNEYRGRGLELHLVAGGWQFRSATANAAFVRQLVAPKPVRLSRAQIESLAIVAYRQPITRPEIDEIRGVDSGPALKVLAERNLLKVLGRKDEPGRPLLYGTTDHFLEFFGLSSLKDLPTLREFSELNEESRELFERRMGEPLDLRAVEAQARAAEAAAQAAMLDREPQQELGLDDDAGEPGEAGSDAAEASDTAEAGDPDHDAAPAAGASANARAGAEDVEDDVAEEVYSSPEFGEDVSPTHVEEQGIEDEPASEERSEMTDERFELEMEEGAAESAAEELDHAIEAISDDFDDADFEAPKKKSVDEGVDEPEEEGDDEDLDEDEEDEYADEDDDEEADDDDDDEYGDDFGDDEDDEYADEDEDEDDEDDEDLDEDDD